MSWIKNFLADHIDMDFDDIEAELNSELKTQVAAFKEDVQAGRKHLAKDRNAIVGEIHEFMGLNGMRIGG